MKFYLLIFLVVTFTSMKAFSHSGGTDSNGCHAGSQPHHCHNNGDNSSSSSVSAWDINAGYQYRIEQNKLIPYIGVSIGKSKKNEDASFGVNLGLRHLNTWYAGYVSTSKSLQVGYDFLHISANSDSLGVGLRFPLGTTNRSNQSSFFYSGSILFSDDE